MTDSNHLRAEYAGAVEAAPDVVVAVEVTGTLHRPKRDAVVDDETRVPADQLTVKQQLEVLVETAEEGRVNSSTRL